MAGLPRRSGPTSNQAAPGTTSYDNLALGAFHNACVRNDLIGDRQLGGWPGSDVITGNLLNNIITVVPATTIDGGGGGTSVRRRRQ